MQRRYPTNDVSTGSAVIRDHAQQGPSNRGGGYVTGHSHAVSSPSRHTLHVHGPAGAIDQVRLLDPSYTVEVTTRAGPHEMHGPGIRPAAATTDLLDLLGTALTVPCGDELDFAVALDWYNKVTDNGGPDHWARTDLADLIYRGKYRDKADAVKVQQVGRAVVGEVTEFIVAHPLLRRIEAIAAVPGHDGKVLSFGSRLAESVARRRGVQFVRCRCEKEFRTPAKQLDLNQRAAALAGLFHSPSEVSGKRVLIIDDVYSSGATAHETARALRAAGAVRVVSLAAVRTLRSL
jgi:adenine/guanine phosphoribosyltransferase-like PRPP-binding protein